MDSSQYSLLTRTVPKYKFCQKGLSFSCAWLWSCRNLWGEWSV